MNAEYFSLAFKNLRKRKLRSWLTMLGIIISIATIFILVSISIGLQDSVKEQFQQLGVDKFFIIPKGMLGPPGSSAVAVELTENDVKAIEKVSGVKAVTYIVAGNAKIEFGKEIRFFPVFGMPLDTAHVFLDTGMYKIDEGRFLKTGDSGVVMLGSQYKYNNIFKRPLGINDILTINGEKFKVKTILQSVGNPQDDKNILMSVDDFRALFNVTERVDQIVVQVQNGENISEVSSRVEQKLRAERGVTKKTQDFSILTPDEVLATLNSILSILTSFLFAIAAISLIVGAIGIANTMFTSVIERTKEIGTMKAVGAKNSDILWLFLIESGMLGLVGGAIGVLLGAGVAELISYIAQVQLDTNLVQAAFPWYLIVGCLAFSFIVGALSGIWPARRASKLKTVDALRYE